MSRAPRVRRRARLGFSFRFAVALLWPFMRVMVRWDLTGTERLTQEEGGIIAAPNHTSWFDPLVVAYTLWQADRPPRFLGKESVFRIPFFGRIITNAGQIPVYRDTTEARTAIRDALTALDAGECVVVYPEGTITRDPDLWPMSAKTGAVRLALSSGRPLFPIAQWGSQLVMGPYRKEFRILPRKTIRVVVGAPVDLSDLAGRPIDGETLAIGGERLMDAITGLLAGIRHEQPPATRMTFRSSRAAGPPQEGPVEPVDADPDTPPDASAA
jgi:1-acyl-sn-glycerol-3-phosphate acyltransferase